MAVRTKRSFSDLEKKNLLNELGNWRSKCVSVCSKAPVKGVVYNLAEKLIADIDTAVEILTGDRKYFHSKPHSTN